MQKIQTKNGHCVKLLKIMVLVTEQLNLSARRNKLRIISNNGPLKEVRMVLILLKPIRQVHSGSLLAILYLNSKYAVFTLKNIKAQNYLIISLVKLTSIRRKYIQHEN